MSGSHKNRLVCRAVTEDDAQALYEFFQEADEQTKRFFHPHPFDIQTLRTICQSTKDHYFVMTLNDIIIGYAMLRLFGYAIPSFGCCICHGYQRKGYGLQLTKWTLRQARAKRYPKVILTVYKENEAALTMYTQLGFTIVGETDDHRQYRMELLLE